jgi:glutamyl endopeptidase
MAAGHEARRNERDLNIRSEAAEVFEAAEVEKPQIPTLEYYKPLRPKRLARRARPRILNEGALEGMSPEAAAADTGPADTTLTPPRLPDAAVASFGNPIVLEVVIGNDDRVRVKDRDLRRNPFRQICALRIKAKNGAMYVGTGWFIGPRTIATAGHCVYMHKEGGWAASIDVIPAKFGPREPYQRVTARKFRTVDGWIKEKRQDLDYAVILLDDESIGKRVGWFEVAAQSDGELKKSLANISGYPADLEQAEFQFFHARPLGRALPTRVEYDIDTFGGQSGSPVWVEGSGGVVAIGVHTTGAATGNSGTRITEPVIDNFITWGDE